MQPYSAGLAGDLTPQQHEIRIGPCGYRADLASGVVVETGPNGRREYRIEHALGGKNVYYFLTSLEKGRLQTLPLAYDVNRKEWLDTAASGVRHVPGQAPDQPLHWQEWPYTFNTSCRGCHVSRLSTGYDPGTDSYRTVWAEPGISCETCHGSGAAHIGAARATPKGRPLTELEIIRTSTMTREQRNDLCASCHAKASPLTPSFLPGERFFDHFDLATLEDPDFYPDGRDLGENYTCTSWAMSPCAKSGRLDCLHCHTSSGRYRFRDANFNDACRPCHDARVNDPAGHTHHQPEGEGSRCIACHMPMTSFARMNRSDHSMLPPAPAATLAFGSPNACNLCHADRDADWADRSVRAWARRDYQAPVLRRARLIEAARRGEWSGLAEMLEYVRRPDRDAVFTASLLRLLPRSEDGRVGAAALTALRDPSPLVRAAAAQALALHPGEESLRALLEATGDVCRLVRVRAAAGLAGVPGSAVPASAREPWLRAKAEYLASLTARPDLWASHYNLGNYYLQGGEPGKAIDAYRTALRLEPRSIMALVNSAMAQARLGENSKAEEALARALGMEPANAAANFNMGLLEAEQGDLKGAEAHLRAALRSDPGMAAAAYNLCILTAADRWGEAAGFCRQASELRPDEPRYAYTLAFHLSRNGRTDEAVRTLEELVRRHPGFEDAGVLLRELSGR